MTTVRAERVLVNVYDLNGANESLVDVGLGVFHSGIELHGVEYSFASGGGIMSHAPRRAQGAVFREAVFLGEVRISSREVEALVSSMRPEWPGTRYHVLRW